MSKKREKSDIRITPYHVNNSVTGSSVLCEVDGLKILFDIGMFQSQSHKTEDIYKINYKKMNIPFDELDYIILSSAHADHSSALGLIGRDKLGFKGKVISTELSQELIALNVRDSAHLMANECEAFNKNKPEDKCLLPLYTGDEAEKALSYIQGYGYCEKIKLNEKVNIEFIPNGHLSGDGSIYLTYQKDEYTKKRVLYTGDHNYGRTKPFTKQWIDKCLKVDIIITESTYSGQYHEKIDWVAELEKQVVDVCLNKKQILFLPTFAIHRQTEVLYMLYKIFKRNEKLAKAKISIFSAGVMSAKAHRILGNPIYKDFYDEEWKDLDDFFEWDRIEYIEQFKDVESKLLDNKCKVVCSSSGMCSGGYSSYLCGCYLPRNNVHFLFNGYQAVGTVGERILNSTPRSMISVQGKKYVRDCKVLPRISLSGHADMNGLVGLIKSLDQRVLKKVIIIHGDDDRKEILKETLEKTLNNKDIIIPKVGEVIKV